VTPVTGTPDLFPLTARRFLLASWLRHSASLWVWWLLCAGAAPVSVFRLLVAPVFDYGETITFSTSKGKPNTGTIPEMILQWIGDAMMIFVLIGFALI
jgi:hypothetical protein